jgi:hypothetical protein
VKGKWSRFTPEKWMRLYKVYKVYMDAPIQLITKPGKEDILAAT